jgi:hypothetical protein
VTARRAPSGPPRIGIEHEFQVFDGRASVDARRLLPQLKIDGRRIDPGDRNASRCRWGGVITADGREAEIATPPVRLDLHAIDRVVDLATAGRRALTTALGAGYTVRGYSTHINVELPERLVVAAARLVAERMAPALMLVIDRQDSPGLLVRPRHGRLELGGEFVDGERLRDALVLAAGSVLVAGRAARDRRYRRRLPPAIAQPIQRSPQRFGWYVDRRASGADLYGLGRDCALPVRARLAPTMRAQSVLERTWQLARDELHGLVAPAQIAAVDALVDGDHPLPVAWKLEDDTVADRAAAHRLVEWPAHLVDDWERAGIHVTTTAATWHRVVMRATFGAETRWLSIAGEHVDRFVDQLAGGELDTWLRRQFVDDRRLRGWR